MTVLALLITTGVMALAAVAFGLLMLSERRRADGFSEKLHAAAIELASARERARNFEEGRETMAEYLRAQAAQSAQAVAEQLVTRASESFRAQDQLAHARIEAQLKPVTDTLTKFETHVAAIEKARVEETGGLKAQIAALMQASIDTQSEARRLSGALRRGAGVQGRWGEQMLRNVLEMAGLQHGVDFHEQVNLNTADGRLRPDVTVKMPGNAAFVVDSKVSLTAFLEAQAATDDASREEALTRHVQSLRTHVQQLSAKGYSDALEQSPDFVVMFVPGDGILAAALERASELMQEAMTRRVIIATPSTLFALCKAVSYGWRVESQAKNAEQVARLGKELHKRIADMAGHVSGVGKALETVVNRYNGFVGSLESRVLPAARQFETLKIDNGGKPIDEVSPIETAVKPLVKLTNGDHSPEASALTLGSA